MKQTSAPGTVPQTRELQEALAAAKTHGKRFFVTHGSHITSDNMFKVTEIGVRKIQIDEKEKDKKS